MTEFDSLSSKQKSLFKRLGIMCRRISELELPVRIEELWGFGSVIRGKESPGDMDLVAKYSGFHPAYYLFKQISQAAIKKYGWVEDRPPTPKDAIVQYMTTLPVEANEITVLFASWLEGITWGTVFKEMTPSMFGYHWEYLTKRILHRSLRSIHIMRFAPTGDKPYLAAEAYQLFWSRDKSDLAANLRLIFSPDEIRKSCMTELQNFESQLAPLKVELEITGQMFPRLIKYDGRFTSYDECTKWLVQQARKAFPQYSEQIIEQVVGHRAGLLQDTAETLPVPNIPNDMPLDTLKEQVENKRNEVKQLQQELKVLDRAMWFVKDFKVREPKITHYELEEWVTLMTLEDVPKYFVDEQKIREYLRKLGLPEHKVESVKHEGSRTYYSLKDE